MDLSREGHMSPMSGESEEAAKRIEEANVNIAGKGDSEVEESVSKYEAMVKGEIDKMTPEEKDRMMGIEKGPETNN